MFTCGRKISDLCCVCRKSTQLPGNLDKIFIKSFVLKLKSVICQMLSCRHADKDDGNVFCSQTSPRFSWFLGKVDDGFSVLEMTVISIYDGASVPTARVVCISVKVPSAQSTDTSAGHQVSSLNTDLPTVHI